MSDRGNIYHLRWVKNLAVPAADQSGRQGKDKHPLHIDYRHLHLKHRIDISAINLGRHANANRRTPVLIAVWRALRRLAQTLEGRAFHRS